MNASVPISQHVLIFEPRWISSTRNSGAIGNTSIGRGTGWRPVLFDRKFTKPSNSNCVVKYTLKWLPMSGVEGHSTHWRLLVFSIKYGQSNAQFTRGSWSWRLYSRNGLRTWGLEEYCCRRKEWIRFGMSIDFSNIRRILLVLCAENNT